MKIRVRISSFTFLALVTIANLATVNPAKAQDSTAKSNSQTTTSPTSQAAAQSTTQTAAQLSEAEWKAVEGVFALDQDKEKKVQFKASGGMLVGKLLWNGGEVHLIPSSPLAFTSKESEDGEPIKLHFLRDSAGQLNRVDVGKNGTLTRVKNYQPDPPKKEMAHTPEQLKPFEGLFRLQQDPSRFIQFTVKGNSLILKQHWDGNEEPFQPGSEMAFFAPAFPNFTLDFKKDEKGNITSVLAFKHDNWIKVKAPQLTGEQWKAVAGTYISKDDPDNGIRLTEHDNHLLLTQLWDKKVITLDPLADEYFYNTPQSYPLLVRKDDKGNITGVLILGMDLFLRKPAN